jgi:RNA polymerase sigma factor FliA
MLATTSFGEHMAQRTRGSQLQQSRCLHEPELLKHLPQVRLIAMRIRDRFRPNAEFEDLVSYGTIGLIGALSRFDASRGILFKTYADHRIRGAILDGLRTMNWLSRAACRQKKDYAHLSGLPSNDERYLHARRHPPLREIACRGVDLEVLQKISEESGTLHITEVSVTPSAVYEHKELSVQLGRAVSYLPKRERQLLRLYYGEELTMRQIAEILNIRQSRVSQLHGAAIKRLRNLLAPLERSFAHASEVQSSVEGMN